MKPNLSIITPSYNQGRFIQQTIESVLTQNVRELEYLVIDGGSTDNTLSILRRYTDRLGWVSESDAGHADAVNKGILATTGEIVGWLNSDDIYYADALEHVQSFFATKPNVDVLYGDANHVDEQGGFVERYPTADWHPERLKTICFLAQPATFVRRRVFERYGLLDTRFRYSFDYEFWLRLARAGARFEYLPTILAATRLHAEAATIARRVECHADINSMTRHYFGRTPDRWLFNYAQAIVLDRPEPVGSLPRTLKLASVAIGAALRWNHGVTPNMLTTLARWLVSDATRPVRAPFERVRQTGC